MGDSKEENDEQAYGGLGCLFTLSLAAAYAVATVNISRTARIDWVRGVVVFFLYPAIGALCVRISETAWQWAHGLKERPWTRDQRAWIGSFWPITLPFYLLASAFVAFTSLFFN